MDKPKDKPEKKESNNDKIKELEDLIANSKYNKRTQKAIGLYKAQLAKLKEKQQARSSKGKKGEGFSVRKTGDGTVVLLGFPSVGKSTLLNKLTNANSEVGSYAFTTLTVIPGTLEHNFAKIQILDVPGIVHGAASGTGRGKEVLAVIRSADLIVIVVDVFHPEHYKAILKEVYDSHVRINQQPPVVKITRTMKGGIDMGSTVKLTKIDKETVENILREFKIINANVVIRTDIDIDQFIDAVEGNKSYIPAITILNKIDMIDKQKLEKIKKEIKPDICISAEKGINLEELKEHIYKKLRIIRIFLKEVDKKPDMDEPLMMWENSTLRDLCRKLHKDFEEKFKFAKIWGKSAKYDGQKIMKLDHVIQDKDVIEIRIK